jgi:signal transduction histidine kinase/ligand-binding sensor domain-containing protein/DNA-binding response OmpR family regulator
MTVHHISGYSISVYFVNGIYCALWLLFLLLLPVAAQNMANKITFERVQLNDYESLSVKAMLQDSRGFMWFGTTQGLMRFDGVETVVYRNVVTDTSTISNSHILSLFEDRDGYLWAGTLIHGLNRLDHKTGQFRRFMHDPNDSTTILSNQVYTIYQDRAGGIWVGTNFGFSRYNGDGKGFTRYLYEKEELKRNLASGKSTKALVEDHQGRLWAGTDRWLYCYDQNRQPLFRFEKHSSHPDSLSGSVTVLFEDSRHQFWIGTFGGGLNRFDSATKSFERFVNAPNDPGSISNNYVWAIMEDRSGNLWVGTEGGVNIFQRETGKFVRLTADPQNPHSLGSNFITALTEDATGTVWVGSGNLWDRGRGGGYGVYKWDPGQAVFRHMANDPLMTGEFENANIHCVTEDRDGITWLGSKDQGLIRVDRSSGEVRRFTHDPENLASISQNAVMSLLEDHQGVMWVGTFERGLNRLDRRTESFTRFAHDPNNSRSLSHNRITHMHEDHNHNLWLATFGGGLNRFDKATQSFTYYKHDPENPWSIGENQLAKITQDSSGMMWIATWGGGLNRFNPVTETFTRYTHDPQNPQSISDNITWDVHVDHHGAVWVVTSSGLNKLDTATGNFTRYTVEHGLASNRMTFIQPDKNGHFWLGTIYGLTRFDPATETAKRFTMLDGLISNSYSFGDPWKTRAGEIILCGNGFTIFHPDSIHVSRNVPPVLFTRLTRYRRDENHQNIVVDNEISERQVIELTPDDQTFTVEFAALNYRNAAKNSYAYLLEGAQDQWVNIGNQRQVTFSSLPPGHYTLRVKGSNNDQVWNEQGAALKIIVHPAWWRTWWAYSLYALLALMFLYGIRRYEMNLQQLRHNLELEHVQTEKEQMRADKLKELDHLKSQFFANISHEFRTPLTLILGPLEEMIAQSENEKQQAGFQRIRRNARRLQRLINQLLDLSKLESGKMALYAEPLDVVQLTRFIAMAFESLAHLQGIQLNLELPETPIKVYLDRDKYEKIIANLLSNALKFTPEGGEVQVIVAHKTWEDRDKTASIPERKTGSTLPGFVEGLKGVEIRVTDTGSGIHSEQLPHVFDRFYQADNSHTRPHEGTGIGLALTKELVELHGGKIRVNSEEGKGTTFTVWLPLDNAHLVDDKMMEIGNWHQETESSISDEHIANFEIHATDAEQPISDKNAKQLKTKPTANEVILIVEDNADMRQYMRGHLENNYRIMEAENGVQGLKTAQQHSPGLIISDVMMPEMDGFALCKKLKTDARTSHIPVILLTARASGDSKIEGLETGADDYLTKPFDARELLVRVKNLIAQRRRLQERFRQEVLIQPSEVTATSMDEEFLGKAMAAVEAHIDDPSFDTDQLAGEVGVSRRHLNRKLRALTGQSAREFIRTIRLKRAAQLLQQAAGSVTEIAYDVGFQSLAYFAKTFRKHFGVSPSEFKKQLHE